MASPRYRHALLLLPLGITAALAAYRIGARSLWLDEVYRVSLAGTDWPTAWHTITTREANMVLYYALLHYWLRLGHSEAVVRALSAVAAIFCVIPLYCLGLRLFGATHALLASVLLSINAFFIRYAQEARGYTLLLLLTTISSLLFIRALDRPTTGRWIAYVVVSALAVYAHLFGVWVLAVQLLGVIFLRQAPGRRWRFIAAQVAIAGLLTPIALWASRRHNALDWVPRPTLRSLAEFGDALTGYGGPVLSALVLGACALFLLASWLPGARPESRKTRWSQGFLLAWLAVPVLGTFVFSLLITPAFSPRFLISSLAPLALLAAGGVLALRPVGLRIAVVLALLGFAARGRPWYVDRQKEDWRAATAYLLAAAAPGDGLVFAQTFARRPFDYYLAALRPKRVSLEPVFPAAPWGDFVLRSPGNIWTFSTWWAEHPDYRQRFWMIERLPDEGAMPEWLPGDFLARYCLAQTALFPHVRARLYRRCGSP